MTFTVPESGAAAPENRFHFQIGEKKYDVPKLSFAPVEASLLFEQGEQLAGLIACCDDPSISAALRRLNRDQLAALEDAWVAASKVSPGESEGSDGS
jgi:hypothetical protein